MTEIVNINAVLVTGEDEKGNEFTHARFSNGDYADLYNEVFITEAQFRALYPIVKKVYFSEVTMTGDQWRDIQCPLSMTREQLDQWRENIQYVDVWCYENELVDTGLNDDRPYKPAKPFDDGLDDSIIGALP